MRAFRATTPARQAAFGILAVAGFISLVGTGIWFAAYSSRFTPSVISRIGGAAVYLGSVFTPEPSASLSVVPTPTASTTIPSNEASSTISTSVASETKPAAPVTAGEKTSSTYAIGSTTPVAAEPAKNGLPDFVVRISATGYLATTSAESFIASSTVPAGSRPAVTFSIKNIGNTATGSWRFNASIPTQTAYVFESQPQQSLNPGDSIDYTLGFDQANTGVQTISITANFDGTVKESVTDNDNASAKITILGG